ncbi:MAG TPA: hypothetical protein PLG20_08085 [Candidatus Syntrophosphaera sp.]|nr:hypothetical protein [Candidatus Syntrophosphaera sp.]
MDINLVTVSDEVNNASGPIVSYMVMRKGLNSIGTGREEFKLKQRKEFERQKELDIQVALGFKEISIKDELELPNSSVY